MHPRIVRNDFWKNSQTKYKFQGHGAKRRVLWEIFFDFSGFIEFKMGKAGGWSDHLADEGGRGGLGTPPPTTWCFSTFLSNPAHPTPIAHARIKAHPRTPNRGPNKRPLDDYEAQRPLMGPTVRLSAHPRRLEPSIATYSPGWARIWGYLVFSVIPTKPSGVPARS